MEHFELYDWFGIAYGKKENLYNLWICDGCFPEEYHISSAIPWHIHKQNACQDVWQPICLT